MIWALKIALEAEEHISLVDARPSDAPFWTLSIDGLCEQIRSSTTGLSAPEAAKRLAELGQNIDVEGARDGLLKAIFRRLLEPLSLILLVAGVVSLATGDAIGGTIIILILTISIGLDTIQEGHAVRAADILRKSVALKAEVRRDGAFIQIPVESVVQGDVIRIRAGDIIPADALGHRLVMSQPYPD